MEGIPNVGLEATDKDKGVSVRLLQRATPDVD